MVGFVILLTPKDKLIPEPENADRSLRPPTKMDGTLNQKFAMKEKFVHGIFTGTDKKMRYTAPLESLMPRPPKKRVRRDWKLTPMRKHVVEPIKPGVFGGPNTNFLA